MFCPPMPPAGPEYVAPAVVLVLSATCAERLPDVNVVEAALLKMLSEGAAPDCREEAVPVLVYFV